MAKKKGTIEIIALIVVVLAIITIMRSGAPIAGANYWAIDPPITCDLQHEDQICSSLIWECMAHIEQGYNWDGDIRCINGRCSCMSDGEGRLTYNSVKKEMVE